MDPGAAFLLMRGLKTLEVRVRRQGETAMAVAPVPLAPSQGFARALSGAACPPRPSAGQAADGRLRFDAGVLICAEACPPPRRFCDRVRVFLLAASLGGVESLVVLPIYTSH